MDNKNVAQIQTDEIWNNCNKENRTLLNDYIIELKSKKRKMTTISQYITDGKYIMSYIYLFNRICHQYNNSKKALDFIV